MQMIQSDSQHVHTNPEVVGGLVDTLRPNRGFDEPIQRNEPSGCEVVRGPFLAVPEPRCSEPRPVTQVDVPERVGKAGTELSSALVDLENDGAPTPAQQLTRPVEFPTTDGPVGIGRADVIPGRVDGSSTDQPFSSRSASQ